MATFGERLKLVRNEKNLTLDKLAEILGTTKATLSRYENNLREPKNEFTHKCANFFQVSVDYLLGRTDVRTVQKKANPSSLTSKESEELDKDANKMIDDLKLSLSKNREYLSEKDYEVLLISTRNLLETMAKKNKEKYTPKKYKDK